MNWDKFREWIQTLGLVSIPIVVAFAGNAVAKSNATREVDAKMVEIAAHVLTSPVNDSTRSIRKWAIEVLKHHSDVPFPESYFERFQLPGETPIRIQEHPNRLMVFPTNVTLVPNGQFDFTAVAFTDFDDTARISDLTWTASGGSITASPSIGGRHYALFKAGTATGDFVVVARSASARLADSAHVHVQAR